MRITQTHIAETLFADDEMLTFEEVVDILRMEFTYELYDDNMAGVKFNIPCMGLKGKFTFCFIELTNNYLSSEWMIRREIVNNLKLESWLNTPIDCSTEDIMYFNPQNFGINVDIWTLTLDNRKN